MTTSETEISNPAMPEPKAGRSAVPVWLPVLVLVFLFLGMVYFDQKGAWLNAQVYAPYHSIEEVAKYQPPPEGVNVELGRQRYDAVCALCHDPSGSGKPNQAPPLAGSEWVQGSPARLIRIPMVGLNGPIKVKEQEWNLSMPAMGSGFSDEELSAVLTYIRQSWGNKAPEITPGQVKAVRAEVGNRAQLFTVPELLALPEK